MKHIQSDGPLDVYLFYIHLLFKIAITRQKRILEIR